MFCVAIGSIRWVYMIDLPSDCGGKSSRHITTIVIYYLSLSSLQRCLIFLLIPIKFLVDHYCLSLVSIAQIFFVVSPIKYPSLPPVDP